MTSPFARREGAPLAAYWQRAGALMLDGLVFLVTVALPATLAVWWFGESGLTPCDPAISETACPEIPPGDLLISRVTFYSLGAIFVVVYAAAIGRGRTVGKRATACKVVDAEVEQPIGFRRGVVRTLAMVVSAVPFGLGFLWPLWDRRRRTFHDMIAGTRVISP